MMISRVFNERYSIIKTSHIKLIFFLIYFWTTINTVRIIFDVNINGYINSMYLPEYIGKLVLILCIIAYVSSLLYYYSNKDEDLFVISLVYLNLLVNTLLSVKISYIYNTEILFLSAYFRIIILICAANINNKSLNILKTLIINNKGKAVIIVILCSMLEISLDSLGFLSTIKGSNTFLIVHLILIILGYIVFNILWVKKSLKHKDVVYTFILASIMFLSVRRIYSVLQRLFPQLTWSNGYEEILLILTMSSLLLLILGILFEVIKKILKSNILEDELTVFYNLMEFNYHSSIVLFDKNKNLIYANERIRQQYSSEESFNIKEQYKELQSFIENTINGESTLSIEDIIDEIEKKGAWKSTLKVKGRFMRVECQKLYVKTGKFYYAASVSDVTDDYELHEKLNKSKSIVENITENIQDLIVVIDNDSNITYTNDAVKRSLGYIEEDLIEHSIKKLLLEDVADKILNSDSSRIECALIKKEENEFLPVEAIKSDVTGKDGSILGKILVFRDLTISNEINTLTKQFNEAKIYEKAKSEFFANLSHEFRTPLNIFSSTIQLLDLKCDNDECNFHEEYKTYREGLKHNCNRMIRLITNIIDLTKIDSGILQSEFTNYNIVELVENVTMSIIPFSKSKNLNVVFDTLNEDINIKCDLHKMERAILNILSNAIKFTQSGGTILVEVSNDEQWVYINIKDDGRGISEEMQQLIFEKFVQVDKSLNRNTEGSGMGLCIAKAMIDIHGGEIILQSDGVNGSEFIIKLPNEVMEEFDTSNASHIIDIQRVELELSDIYELY